MTPFWAGFNSRRDLVVSHERSIALPMTRILLPVVLCERTLDQADRKVAHDRKCDGRPVEIPPMGKIEQPGLIELTTRMQRVDMGHCRRMLV